METRADDDQQIDLVFQSRLFKVLSEPFRMELLRFLATSGVCDISTVARAFPKDRSVISRHLSLMAEYGLLCSRKRGRNTYYAVNGIAFLHAFEDTTEAIRGLVRQFCPAEVDEYERTGVVPAACTWEGWEN